MFTHHLPQSNNIFGFEFTSYAKKHYLNKFIKKYPGKWSYTEDSIRNDLSRLRIKTNTTQFSNQIDELMHSNNKWIAKYDFSIAGSMISPKSSENRCIVYIDNDKELIKVLLIYSKTDLPKNTKETVYIKNILSKEYPEINETFKTN